MKKINLIIFLITLIMLLCACDPTPVEINQSLTDELFLKAKEIINNNSNKPIYYSYSKNESKNEVFYNDYNCIYSENNNVKNYYANNYHYSINEANQIIKEEEDFSNLFIDETIKLNSDISQMLSMFENIKSITGYQARGAARPILSGPNSYFLELNFSTDFGENNYFFLFFTKDKEFIGVEFQTSYEKVARIIYQESEDFSSEDLINDYNDLFNI